VWAARAADAGNLFDLTTACDAITPDERADVARRLRQRFRRKDRGGATILILAGRGRVGGFAVLVPTNAAQGAFAVETLVVEPSIRRSGFGRLLLAGAEQAAAAAGGRILTADVSSGPAATKTRQFLARVGYRSTGEVSEFYKDGTSRLTFAKPLPAPNPVVPSTPVAATSYSGPRIT
jgi:GNAT superfamily N-acetyltransferase